MATSLLKNKNNGLHEPNKCAFKFFKPKTLLTIE